MHRTIERKFLSEKREDRTKQVRVFVTTTFVSVEQYLNLSSQVQTLRYIVFYHIYKYSVRNIVYNIASPQII